MSSVYLLVNPTEIELRGVRSDQKTRFLMCFLQTPPDTNVKQQPIKKYCTIQPESSYTSRWRVHVSRWPLMIPSYVDAANICLSFLFLIYLDILFIYIQR